MENQTHLVLLVAIGVFAMISLALLITTFYNLSKKKILERESKMQVMEKEKQFLVFKSAKEAEEIQKEKIAKKIHHTVVPVIASTQLSIFKNLSDYNTSNKIDVPRLKKDLELLDGIIDDLRLVSHDLMPSSLSSLGLIKAIEYYMVQIKETSNSLSDFENAGKFDDTIQFTKSDQLKIYEIFLEILNNLFKHSKYKYLKVTLENIDNHFQIEFMHNGKGISNEEVEQFIHSNVGLGLKSLKSNVLFLKASINYLKEAHNSSIIFSVPLKP